MSTLIRIIRGEGSGNEYEVPSLFNKVGSDPNGTIVIPLASLPDCIFVLEYDSRQCVYYVIPRHDHMLSLEGKTLERGLKTLWADGLELEISGGICLVLDSSDATSPNEKQSSYEQRFSDIGSNIDEKAVTPSAISALVGNEKHAKMSEAEAFRIKVWLCILGFVLIFAAACAIYFSFKEVPPPNPTDNNVENHVSYKNVMDRVAQKIADGSLTTSSSLFLNQAMIDEQQNSYQKAYEHYKKLRNELYESLEKKGHRDAIAECSEYPPVQESPVDDLRFILDFTLKKMRFLRWKSNNP